MFPNVQHIDIKYKLNITKSDIKTEQPKSPDEMQNIINDYLLSVILSPLRPFNFPNYNVRYNIAYHLFFTWVVDPEIYDLVYDLKQYLIYYINNEKFLKENMELVDVYLDRNNYRISIVYKIKNYPNTYSLNLNMRQSPVLNSDYWNSSFKVSHFNNNF